MFAYDLNILEQCVQPNRKREVGQPSFKDASTSMSSSSSKFEKFSTISLVSSVSTTISNSVFADVLGTGRSPLPWQRLSLICLARLLRYENFLLQRGHRLFASCSPLTRSLTPVSGGPECVSKCLSKSFFVLSRQLKHFIQRKLNGK